MTFSTTLKATVAAACVIAFAGCTDLKPIQAQIDGRLGRAEHGESSAVDCSAKFAGD
jgi:hypothetical protein